MKKLIALLSIVGGLQTFSQAQCTIVPAQCTPDTLTGLCITPDTLQANALPDAVIGASYSATLQVKVADSVSYWDINRWWHYPMRFIRIDSVVGLPAGLSMSTNPITPVGQGFTDNGCILITGTPTSAVDTGVYNLRIRYVYEFVYNGVITSGTRHHTGYKLRVNRPVAVNRVQLETMQAYPIPARTELVIELPQAMQEGVLVVHNAIGQAVQTHTLQANANTYTLPVAQLAQGIYTATVQTQGTVYQVKFVKE